MTAASNRASWTHRTGNDAGAARLSVGVARHRPDRLGARRRQRDHYRIAARNVPKDKQRAVILWGTAGAIAVRVVLTGAVVWLLKIPGFLFAGGVALVWIGWKLTAPQDPNPEKIAAAASFGAAMRTIVIADAVMGIDNVLAVGGAAQGSFMLVVIGLVISIPIVVWGSALVLKLVDRYPAIAWIGAAVIGWTAAKMIGGEPLLAAWFATQPWLRVGLYAAIVGGLVGIPLWRSLDSRWRAQGLALLVMVAWVSAFGWLETRMGMSATGSPEREYRSAQREGTPMSATDRPEREYRSAQREGTPMTFDLFEHEHWDDEWLDLVRWIGWIPLVIAIDRSLRVKAPA
jgi:YjbE family integral membrane protein